MPAKHGRPVIAASVLLVLAAVFAACEGGEDRPGVTVIDGDGSGTGTGTGSGTGTATGVGSEPGVVQPPPEGAIEVTVVLQEWAIIPEVDSVAAGQVYFLADNRGPEDPHELVIIRTDADPAKLPVREGIVPEDEVEMIGEIRPFAAGSQASGVFELAPGNYALICNIAEEEDGAIESHYELGMRVAFKVK